jgi:hypothetical protein
MEVTSLASTVLITTLLRKLFSSFKVELSCKVKHIDESSTLIREPIVNVSHVGCRTLHLHGSSEPRPQQKTSVTPAPTPEEVKDSLYHTLLGDADVVQARVL